MTTTLLVQSSTSNCFATTSNQLSLDDTTEYSTIEQPMDDEKFDFTTLSLLSQLQTVSEDLALAEHGYTMIEKITDTIQGELIKCRVDSIETKDGEEPKYVAVKKTKKELFKERIAMEDGMSVLVNENIVKESVIQHYLTVANTPMGGYITKFIEFFEDDDYFYLVMEYVSNMNLKDFVLRAHQYIRSKQLKIKEWRKICKYIFWQIAVTLYWMHNDLNCAHLDLCLENIMIENGNFIACENGKIKIDNAVSVKLCDFGRAEVFPKDSDFSIDKYSIIGDTFHLQSPQVNDEENYNAKASDIWSLGIILYTMVIGRYPFRFADPINDPGYKALINGNIATYLTMNNLQKYVDTNLLILLSGCLGYKENDRDNIEQVINQTWLSSYYKAYAQRIATKSSRQQRRKKIITFPHYVN